MLLIGLIPVLVLALALGSQALFAGDLRPYVPLLLGTSTALLIGVRHGKNWKELSQGMYGAVTDVLPALAMLLMVGPLISSWIASGTLPAVILLGLDLVSPRGYLLCSFLVTTVASVAMGSSLSAMGTVGVAMAGLAAAIGADLRMAAAAMASGALCGNILSPMSICANLTPSLVKSDPRCHLKKLWKIVALPFAFSAVGFWLLGMNSSGAAVVTDMEVQLRALFHTNLWCWLPVVVMMILLVFGIPTLPTFAAAIASACAVALCRGGIKPAAISKLLLDGFIYPGTDPRLMRMLNRGGMMSMMTVILLVILGISFGGALRASGLADELMRPLRNSVKSAWGLRVTALSCGCVIVVVSSSSTLAMVLVGELFASACEERGLSRLDFGALLGSSMCGMTPLVPWSIDGAFAMAVMSLPMTANDHSGLMYVAWCLFPMANLLWTFLMPVRGGDRR